MARECLRAGKGLCSLFLLKVPLLESGGQMKTSEKNHLCHEKSDQDPAAAAGTQKGREQERICGFTLWKLILVLLLGIMGSAGNGTHE